MKFTIRQIDDAHVILSIKGFEVHVMADEDGLCAQIGKNNITHAETSFGWDDKLESFWGSPDENA